MRDVEKVAMFVAAVAVAGTAVFAQGAPVPQPFPGSGSSTRPPATAPAPPAAPPPATTSRPSAAPQEEPTRSPAQPQGAIPGVPVYPTAEYLETIDAGSGQQYVIYGANLPFADLLAYYRATLRTGGRELYKTPATHQFDLGRFQNDRMVYPPSIVIKDYTWNNSPGYLFVSGTTEKRYQTIIQIVAPGPAQ